MKLAIAALSLLNLASQSRAHEVNVPAEEVCTSDEGGHFEIPDRRRDRKSLGSSAAQRNQDRVLQAATPMPTCSYSRTYSASGHSRGLYFTAPTDFCIVGLSVPNEMNEQLQNVEVIIRDTIPPLFPASASGGSVFHAAAIDVNEIIATEIQVQTGDVVGLLGTAGSGTMRNSYCAQNAFTTTIAGQSVPIARFLTQNSIAKGPAPNYSREIGNISRVNMFYTPGKCGGGGTIPPEPTPAPSSGATDGVCQDGCGDCAGERAGPGCECPTCRDQVCERDSYCCDVRWDKYCVEDAWMNCECGSRAPSTTPSTSPSFGPTLDASCPAGTCGNCDVGRGETGCGCPKCEDLVCEVDDYCCNNFWDRKCVDLAQSLCDCPMPTQAPSGAPSTSSWPSAFPTMEPSTTPSHAPSTVPSVQPTHKPSSSPSATPTAIPTAQPSAHPSFLPSEAPTQCEGDCENEMGNTCGFCNLRQRGAGCSGCSVCENIVCGLDEGFACCGDEGEWDNFCAFLAATHCNCCLPEDNNNFPPLPPLPAVNNNHNLRG